MKLSQKLDVRRRSVFHSGSDSSDQEIADAVSYGVIKMNIDMDTQYAFARPIVDQMFKNYDGILKVDGEVGKKKTYDPRVWGPQSRQAARPASSSCRVARLSRKEALTMSDQLRKNLLDPEPTLLPDEFELGIPKRQKIAPGVEPSPADSGEGTAPTRERTPAIKTSEVRYR